MTEIADRGPHIPVQKTLDTSAETLTISDSNTASQAFSMNQMSAVCLPLLSESKKIIWVKSDEIDLQMKGTAELNKAFGRFPYLSHRQMAALAQRCSLHPDQVKVWFMARRLQYGISWDYSDIHDVWRKFKSPQTNAQGKKELLNIVKENVKEDSGKMKRKVKVSEGRKAEEAKQEQSAKGGGMREETVRADELLPEQPVRKQKDRKVEEDKSNKLKKRKRISVTDKSGKKKIKQDSEGMVEGAGKMEAKRDEVKSEGQKCTESEATFYGRNKKKARVNKRLMSIQESPACKSFAEPERPLDPLLVHQPQTQTFDASPPSGNQTALLKGDDIPSSTPNIHKTPMNTGLEGKTEIAAWQERELYAEATNHNVFDNDVDTLKELLEGDSFVATDGPSNFPQQQRSLDTRKPPPQTRCNAKTQPQLAMMRTAFSHCQYPDREQYDRLAELVGIPRCTLVQWFSDMRYYLKKGRPRWMNQEKYDRALANIKYRQCINALARTEPIEGAVKMMVESSEGCDTENEAAE
ncbi:homeobox and leucine zipper encoding b [Amphiprion ocellaris]|nr:homeobox and leucine zipper encoding b [Amphiprion ocellaris]